MHVEAMHSDEDSDISVFADGDAAMVLVDQDQLHRDDHRSW